MSVTADFSVPAEAFCLAETLEVVPQITVELDRLVAHSPNYVIPFLWVLGDEWDQFEAALAGDPTVVESTVTDSFSDSRLYQIQWAEVVNERLETILDHEGVILAARGSRDEWRLWVRFGSHEHFGEFEEHFEEEGPVTLHQLTAPKTPGHAQYGVSEKQRKSLLTAYDKGYYDVPRKTTGDEIAERLGITQQALSGRLRRGMATLIENTLGRHRDDRDDDD
ncbi:helix-turn-helix domain-containing protein [Natribaculum luteum]|uniref:Helix-turn-helix domain-containing protein n=1 Tax=Natribaculum luteum TaxID=1586232 RepID=A0ABD5P2L3_9EURY|nr:helix-turn-helix domain-containing protein [Natribaculum luteum]